MTLNLGDYNSIPYFSRKELECHCGCGEIALDWVAVENLVHFRKAMGFPFKLSSAYRCPKYNARVSHTGKHYGAHTCGVAFDILCYGRQAWEIVNNARAFGFHRIGIAQRGDHAKRFIHIDCWKDVPEDLQHTVWSY